MRKEIDKNKRHVGYEKNVRDMKVAEELLERFACNGTFSNFYYELSEQLENAEKQGKCICPEQTWMFKPNESESEKYIGSELIDLSCSYCKDARLRWFKREDIKKKEDFDFLFWHIKKHAKNWWD